VPRRPAVQIWSAALSVVWASTAGGQVFVPGDIYTADDSPTVSHYTPSGTFVASFTLPGANGGSVRGLTYGSDGLVYATVAGPTGGYRVVAVDAAGNVQQTYFGTEFLNGALYGGKIGFGSNGQFFVAGANDLRQFTVGSPNGTVVYTNSSVTDIAPLLSGNLLVLSDAQLDEITPGGAVVRTVIASGPSATLSGARGLAYNPATDTIYVTMFGYTGNQYRLMRVNGTTGAVERSVTYDSPDDLFLTDDGRLLVGSRTLDPASST
jgi:hypothetical protein